MFENPLVGVTVEQLLQFAASAIVFAGVTWACFSRTICDGIFLKKGLVALAFGAAANMIHPSGHAKTWILCSLAVIVVCVVARILQAKMKHTKPVFIEYRKRERNDDQRARAA